MLWRKNWTGLTPLLRFASQACFKIQAKQWLE
jgi:hypothetical protein